MAIENEKKYVVRWTTQLEINLQQQFGYSVIEQAYLKEGSRIRRTVDQAGAKSYVFSYKQRLPTHQSVEIQTDITPADWSNLLSFATKIMVKRRVTVVRHDIQWDIDFPQWASGKHFIIAEAEMPLHMEEPGEILREIRDHVVYAVPRADMRFNARRLTSERHALNLAQELALY